jgi:hypothetical protein
MHHLHQAGPKQAHGKIIFFKEMSYFNRRFRFSSVLISASLAGLLGGEACAQVLSSGAVGVGLAVVEDPIIQKLNLYKINPDGSSVLLQQNIFPERTLNTFQSSASIVDSSTGLIYLREPDQGQGLRYRIYNAATNSFQGYTTFSGLPNGGSPQFLVAPLQMNKVARREGDELHIGENSFITRERNGTQEIYAEDAGNNPIPLNVTNGSDLQINGISVQGQINNLGRRVGNLETYVNNLGSGVAGATALSAALTALPATSEDSPFSCGVGSGGYSNRYAMGFGCAAKVTERLAFNAGGSFVFGGSASYGGGTLDNVAGRLGFIVKIGHINPSSNQAISKRAEKLESELSEVKQENQKLTETLSDMRSLITAQNERLASLEKIAAAKRGEAISGSKSIGTTLKIARSFK